MPELPEIRLFRDFINELSKDREFLYLGTNPKHKGGDPLSITDPFTLSCESRGKEMMLSLSFKDGSQKKILCNMGFATWAASRKEKNNQYSMEIRTEDFSFQAIDQRHFMKWRVRDSWGDDRGPDILDDYDSFCKNITDNINKKAFDEPTYEGLMNQKYFNGVGNYLRAVICFRLGGDWKLPLRDYIILHKEKFFTEIRDIIKYSYETQRERDLESIFYFPYGSKKAKRIKDKNGRTFWYYESEN